MWRSLRSAASLLGLLAALLPLRLWRAGLEGSLWIDEVFSLVLALHDPAEIARLTAADVHPPGHPWLLAGWLAVGRWLPGEPGLLWARGLHVLVWVATVVACWTMTRRLLGPTNGGLVTAAVAASGAVGTMMADLRSYGVAWAALTLATLALVAALDETGRRRLGWWALFVAGATVALWCHLLSAVALACLMGVWALLAARARQWRRLAEAIGASLAIVLAFSPWLVRMADQWRYQETAVTDWMTPPDLDHLALALGYWLPYGRLPAPGLLPDGLPWMLVVPVGFGAVLLPLAALGVVAIRTTDETRPATPDTVRALAVLGLGGAVLYTLALWALARADLAPVFHGPRYPLLAAGPWSAGLAAVAALASRGRRLCPWLLLGPWLALTVLAAAWAGRIEVSESLRDLVGTRLAPPTTLYVMPSEMIPFVRGELDGFDPRPIEELPCHLAAGIETSTPVLDLNPWRELRGLAGGRDRIARQTVLDGTLTTGGTTSLLREAGKMRIDLVRLDGTPTPLAHALCERGWSAAPLPFPDDALAVAHPAAQKRQEGWSYTELRDDLSAQRWAKWERVTLRFDGIVPQGAVVVHLTGERRPFPEETATLRLLLGETEVGAVSLGPGPFHLTVPTEMDRALTDPILTVEHPTWSPAEELGTADRRSLSFLFHAAWIERAD
jgi:hypothetical protein